MNIFKRTVFPILACFFVWSSVHGLTQDRKSQEAPPVIAGIPDVTVDQNSKALHALDLWQYTSDPDTPVSALLFSVSRADESYFQNINLAKLEDNRYLTISPDEGWAGEEEILVEADDGTNIGYAAFKVIIRSTEAGRRIEAEDGTHVERKGAWVTMRKAGTETNWLQSSRPGDSLCLKWKGSFLSVILWGRELNLLQRYYESPDYSEIYESWKNYRPGVASISIDGKQPEEIDLSRAEKKAGVNLLSPPAWSPASMSSRSWSKKASSSLTDSVKARILSADWISPSPTTIGRLCRISFSSFPRKEC